MEKTKTFLIEMCLLFRFWRLFKRHNYQQISPAFPAKKDNMIEIKH